MKQKISEDSEDSEEVALLVSAWIETEDSEVRFRFRFRVALLVSAWIETTKVSHWDTAYSRTPRECVD